MSESPTIVDFAAASRGAVPFWIGLEIAFGLDGGYTFNAGRAAMFAWGTLHARIGELYGVK